MTSSQNKSDDTKSAIFESSFEILPTIAVQEIKQDIRDVFTLKGQSFFDKENKILANEMNHEQQPQDLSDVDNHFEHTEDINNIDASRSTQFNANEFYKNPKLIHELEKENIYLKTVIESKEKYYQEQMHQLQSRITELEDWNEDYQKNDSNEPATNKTNDYSDLQSNIDSLKQRNRQLENDLQRLQSQQQRNQLALERLDEYEETIAQLQDELNQQRLQHKKKASGDDDMTRILIEERKRYDSIVDILEKTRLESNNERQQFQNQLEQKEKEIELQKDECENLKQQINSLEQLKDDQNEAIRSKEMHVREMLERQIIELNEQVQSLENDKYELSCQLDEFRQQLQSKDRIIENFQSCATTPGAPPSINLLSDARNHSLSLQLQSNRVFDLESQIDQYEKQFQQIGSLHSQFLSLLPREFSSLNDSCISLSDRFTSLFEQFSTYIGTFSIIQEEFDSLKQILNERQDELDKLRTHLEATTDKLTRLEEEQSLSNKHKVSYESDEDELEEILGFHRTPSRQSLLSITPGEKQQLIAQNELLSSLLTEKEQEIIELQQATKSHDESKKTIEILRLNLEKVEYEKDLKQNELNDIRNVLDEKIRENSSLKKEKMYFIEKLAELERERQEKQSIIKMSSKQTEIEAKLSTISATEKNATDEQYLCLQSNYDELLELSKRQQDESLSYYNEYIRILNLYNDLSNKHNQLVIDYESIQSLFQQKNEAYLQCQNELNTYQNLLYHQKKKSDDIDMLHSTLNEREIKIQELISRESQLQAKLSDLERNVNLLDEDNRRLTSNQKLFEQIQLDLKRITHERDIAVVEKKQIENEIELNRDMILQYQERERSLSNEIKRLVDIETLLRNQLKESESLNQENATYIQQFNDNNELRQHEFETLSSECIKLSTQLKELAELQKEREEHSNRQICHYQDSLREQISISARLTNENNELNQRLEHSNRLLLSVPQLDDDVKAKNSLINDLKNEINLKNKQIKEYDESFQTMNGTRIDKQLVKNMLFSYFQTPIDKQHEVIPILSALVGFSQEEYQKVLRSVSNSHCNNTNANWFTNWLGTNVPKSQMQSNMPLNQSNKSFAELLIQYVDQESEDALSRSTLKVNNGEHHEHSNPSISTSDNSMHLTPDDKVVSVNSTISNV